MNELSFLIVDNEELVRKLLDNYANLLPYKNLASQWIDMFTGCRIPSPD